VLTILPLSPGGSAVILEDDGAIVIEDDDARVGRG
jgi:hypothetical protein